MNLQQLEYILAVDELRHFAKAAEYCNVTQPTLSAMIQKLEDELNTKLFDRTTQPVQPTLTGRKVIEQARITLRQANLIKDIVKEEACSLGGIIPWQNAKISAKSSLSAQAPSSSAMSDSHATRLCAVSSR